MLTFGFPCHSSLTVFYTSLRFFIHFRSESWVSDKNRTTVDDLVDLDPNTKVTEASVSPILWFESDTPLRWLTDTWGGVGMRTVEAPLTWQCLQPWFNFTTTSKPPTIRNCKISTLDRKYKGIDLVWKTQSGFHRILNWYQVSLRPVIIEVRERLRLRVVSFSSVLSFSFSLTFMPNRSYCLLT